MLGSFVEAQEQTYLSCSFLKPGESQEDKNSSFNRVISYEITNSGKVYAPFSRRGRLINSSLQGQTLSSAYLRSKGKQMGYYREVYEVLYLDLTTNVLTKSWVYYLHPEDFQKNFNSNDFLSQNKPSLFQLIDRKAPENYTKLGWDKTRWRCYKIDNRTYLYLFLKLFLASFGAGA